MTGMVKDMQPDEKRMKAAAGEGYSTATDLADWLVQRLSLPFRDAHKITGKIVARASEAGVALHRLAARRDAGDRAAHHRGRLFGAIRSRAR